MAATCDMITLYVSSFTGDQLSVEVQTTESVDALKSRLASMIEVPKGCLQLLIDTQVLEDSWLLTEHGAVDGSMLSVIKNDPNPPWAAELGLNCEHPNMLREYYAKHALEMPDWLHSDDTVWEMWRQEREAFASAKLGQKHLLHVEKDGLPAALCYSSPGEFVTLRIHGDIFNSNGDCPSYFLLGLDRAFVAVLGSAFDSTSTVSTEVTVHAPRVAGTYMLWVYTSKSGFTEQIALSEFREKWKMEIQCYAKCFIGWLVVFGETPLVVVDELPDTDRPKSGDEYQITLQRTEGTRLAWKLDTDGTVLHVAENIGLIREWNDYHPLCPVMVGDRLAEINGIRDDLVKMHAEAKTSQVLNIKLIAS